GQPGGQGETRLGGGGRPEAPEGLVGTGVAEARRAHVDGAGVDLVDALPGEPPAGEDFAAEVLDHRVRDADEPRGQVETLGMTRVQADGQLAVVQDREVRRRVVGLLAVGVPPAVQGALPGRELLLLRALDDWARVSRVAVIVPRSHALDVNDLRAEVGEQARRPWPHGLPREIEDTDAAENALGQGRRGAHRMTPAAASASICAAGRPRSDVKTSRVCSPRWGA